MDTGGTTPWRVLGGVAACVLAACSEDPTPRDVAADGALDAADVAASELDASDGQAIDETVYVALDSGETGPADVVGDHADVVRAADAYYGGASACDSSAFTLCEGFETGAWAPSIWTPHTTNGTLTVDATHVARGTHALHVHTATTATSTGASAYLTATHGFPPASDTYWGRAFVYMAATAAPTTHATLFESGGAVTLDGQMLTASERYSIIAGTLFASYDTSPRPPITDYGHRSTIHMPLGRWACFEWEFKGNTNEAHYYLDDAELTALAVAPTTTPAWTAPMWGHIQAGLQLYSRDAVSTFDVWIDEIAIAPTRIRCEH